MGWFHTKKSSPAVTPDYTGLQLQTSVNTLPVAIVWGESKIAPNVIWYSNFQTHTQTENSGGKGFFRTATTSGNTYSADLILALCEGPIASIGQIWKDQSIYTLSSLGLSLFTGTTPQSVWGYLAAANPAQALTYQGTAYACAASYALGDDASISNHNFEVRGILYGSGINGVDADPAEVISDFLTNAQYGLGFNGAGINAATLFGASGDSSLQTYCRASGICFSPALTDQEQSSSILARWLQICNCAAVWSGGQLKFIPYAEDAVTGNGYTFNPDVTPIYSLADNDFVDAKSNEDPVLVSRVDPFSLPTIQRIEVMDRTNQYGSTPIEARDQSQIELYGPRVGSTVTAHEICDVSVVAPIVAQTILQRALYVRANFTFKLSWEYCLLDPMDIVAITDANLGLSNYPVRVLSIEEDDSGILTVTAEEVTIGVSTPALYPAQSASSTIPNQGATPDSVNAPVIFEPPPALTGGVPQLWVGASGGASGAADPNWGGAFVWASIDNVTYTEVATITQPIKQGFLTSALPSATGYGTTNTLAVNLAESAGALASTTAVAAQQGVTLALVDDELLAYAAATLTGANAYDLTGLARGLYGSTPAAHANGATFARLDASIVKYDLPSGFIGQTLYLKLQGFNVFGGGVQDLAACTAYAYTLSGAGALGPIASSLAAGTPLDYDLVSHVVSEADDFGDLTSPYATTIDLGTLSS
ncbi:phage tail protein [Methylocapsa sp. S129]|uniref:phage tail protein n=1 Tax=Methylocapsa sp. S129 TaxID=1641869 RepID=UPI00131A89E2|nr:phage tail protein [Methylocapsa sp. S129]